VVVGGRVLLVWLPVFFVVAQTVPTGEAVLAASAASAIWVLGIRAALGAYFTLGPAAAVATGTVVGFVAVSALDLWVPDIDLGLARLAEAAAAVFVLSAAWENAVRSIAKRRVLVVGSGGCAS
jgi:hypothetical protein